MNYYISETADAAGSHGPLHDSPAAGRVCLPAEMGAAYLAAGGFVTITVDAGHVRYMAPDDDAREAYAASHPEPEPTPSLEQRVAALEATMQAPPGAGVSSEDVWAEMAAAYREGVQSA